MQFNEQYYWRRPGQQITAAYIPGTEELVRAHSRDETIRRWRQECDRRGIELVHWKRTFQDCACRALPPHQRTDNCWYLEGEGAPAFLKQPRMIGVGDVFGFLKTAADWWRSDDTVPQALAEERAATCAMCPMNVSTSTEGCTSCSGILSKIANGIREVIGTKRTESDDKLHNCAVCGCVTSLLVHVPISVLEGHTDWSQQYPDTCWKLKERQG